MQEKLEKTPEHPKLLKESQQFFKNIIVMRKISYGILNKKMTRRLSIAQFIFEKEMKKTDTYFFMELFHPETLAETIG